MKKYLFMLLIPFLFSCKKDSDDSGSSDEFDISEGQTNWTKYDYVPITSGIDEFRLLTINDIHFVDDQVGFLTGSQLYSVEPAGFIYGTMDGGENWEVVYKHSCGSGSIGYSVFFQSPNRGFAGMECNGTYLTVTASGGSAWSLENNLPTQTGYFNSKPRQKFVIDSDNLLIGNLKSTDGGLTWQTINLPSNTNAYFFQNTSYGVCATYYGLVAETNDSGATWDTLYQDSTQIFRSIVMTDPNTIIAGGTNMIRSTDNGASWTETSVNLPVQDLEFVDANTGFAATSLDFTSEENTGEILKTTDGGTTWLVNYTSNFIGFRTLERINATTVICSGKQSDLDGRVGAGYVVKTTTLGD